MRILKVSGSEGAVSSPYTPQKTILLISTALVTMKSSARAAARFGSPNVQSESDRPEKPNAAIIGIWSITVTSASAARGARSHARETAKTIARLNLEPPCTCKECTGDISDGQRDGGRRP